MVCVSTGMKAVKSQGKYTMNSSTALAMKLPDVVPEPRQGRLVGEKALLAALLDAAAHNLSQELLYPTGTKWHLWLQDYLWVMEEEDLDYRDAFSFNYTCDNLGYDSIIIREKMLKKVPQVTLEVYNQWSSKNGG